MRKLILSTSLIVTLIIFLSPAVSAFSLQPRFVSQSMTHRLVCGYDTCKMIVDLKLPFETFAPAEVLWKHKIGNSEYSPFIKASTTYVIPIKKQSQIVTVHAQAYGINFLETFTIQFPDQVVKLK